ncbi:MAG: ABC transporter permease [Lachnospiraceae bacterium]
MIDYVKSEFYRITHSASFYWMLVIFATLAVAINLLLVVGNIAFSDGGVTTNNIYSSFGFLIDSPMLFCYAAVVVVYMLYEGNKNNGNLKNSIAFGISRTSIFLGKCIVGVTATTVCMMVCLAAYIGSALVLLTPGGSVTLQDVLMEIPAVFFITLSAAVLGIVVIEVFEKGLVGLLVWLFVFVAVPPLVLYAGAAVNSNVLVNIATWLPANFLQNTVTPTDCITVWDTAEGMLRCLISGIGGILVFLVIGITALRKKPL